MAGLNVMKYKSLKEDVYTINAYTLHCVNWYAYILCMPYRTTPLTAELCTITNLFSFYH
jgi:hypothetical protein